MRRLVGRLLEILPFDPRSRRAIDETLLDWAREAGQASSIGGRSVAHVLGLLGVLRAAAGCSLSEIWRAPVRWIALRLMWFGVPMSLLLTLPQVTHLAKSIGGFRAAEAFVWLLPGSLILAAAPALLLALAWRPGQRHVPAIGTAIIASLAMFVLWGWLLPLSNERFSARMALAISETQGTPLPVRTIREPTLMDYVRQLDGQPSQRNAALRALVRIAGHSVLAGATVLLAAVLRRRVRMQRLRLIVAIPAAYYVSAIASFPLLRQVVPRGFMDLALVWLFVALTLALFACVHRRDVNGAALEAHR
jgi:hypothetical protein